MQGLMQEVPLMISSLIRHADRYHGDTEIVSRTVEGPIHRYTYRDAHRRARQLARTLAGRSRWHARLEHEPALRALLRGVRHRRDHPHDQSAAVLRSDRVHRRARRGLARVLRHDVHADRPQARATIAVGQGVDRDDRSRAHARNDREAAALLRRHRRRGERQLRMADVRREHRVRPLLHVGHDRASQRRAVQPPINGAARVRERAARHEKHDGANRRATRRADVPRQRVGTAVHGTARGRKARSSRARPRRREPVRTDRRRARRQRVRQAAARSR